MSRTCLMNGMTLHRNRRNLLKIIIFIYFQARDIIFQVEVPALEAPQVEAKPILHFTVQYFNVLTCAQEEVSCSCQLSRPEACVNPPKPIPLELDKQKNRIICTEALTGASQLGQVVVSL